MSSQPAEIQIGNLNFDPSNTMVKSQLLALLGAPEDARIEKLSGNTGGLNEGAWTLRSQTHDLILKLVSANRHEGEKILQLMRKHPSMMHDAALSFPVKVVHCMCATGLKKYDLMVMPRAQGIPLGDFIGEKWWSGKGTCVMRILQKLGACLRQFHSCYGNSQHGDFQPSNIFYDEAADKITFIDVADIGKHNPDKDHFMSSLKIISQAYGANFFAEASRAFQSGYGR
jgi:hypothetical protein